MPGEFDAFQKKETKKNCKNFNILEKKTTRTDGSRSTWGKKKL
jgi:hypothetical protein